MADLNKAFSEKIIIEQHNHIRSKIHNKSLEDLCNVCDLQRSEHEWSTSKMAKEKGYCLSHTFVQKQISISNDRRKCKCGLPRSVHPGYCKSFPMVNHKFH